MKRRRSMIGVALCGVGRIGRIHAHNIASVERAALRVVVDPDRASASEVAERFGARATSDAKAAIEALDVDAVVIASPTDTHVELIRLAAAARKAVFCEKPIDLDRRRVDALATDLERAKISFSVGFNRRFDPNFSALKQALDDGAIGRIEMLSIVSRDPAPPPPEYVRSSGGLFLDMMIHDLDMARWLLGHEPVRIHAMASALVDPAIGRAGDVDTAMVTLETSGGTLCHIANSRRAAYGYDQRIEAFGERGMLRAENVLGTTVERWTADGLLRDKPLHFFLERYREAYASEMREFIDAIAASRPPALPGFDDGRRALVLAEAARESFATRAPVTLD